MIVSVKVARKWLIERTTNNFDYKKNWQTKKLDGDFNGRNQAVSLGEVKVWKLAK